MSQAIRYNGTRHQKAQFKKEIEQSIAQAFATEHQAFLDEIYVTDHQPKQKRYHTLNSEEDELFFRYKQSVAQYNQDIKRKEERRRGKYKPGSFMQKLMDPLGAAEKMEDGRLRYKMQPEEISPAMRNEEILRKEFEKVMNENSDVWEMDESDETDMRVQIFEALHSQPNYAGFDVDDFYAVLDEEFSVFKEGEEEYDFVTDLHKAYDDDLSLSTAAKIFRTIPDHVFWDIKKPLKPEEQIVSNPYHPGRMYPWVNFFELVDYEESLDRKTRHPNLRDAQTLYRRY